MPFASSTALALSLAAATGPTGVALPDDFGERATAILEQAYDADAPGASVIVVDDGEVVFQGARGLADVEAGTPISHDTVFRYASITKQFTAATILQLVGEGKVDLDAPLTDYLPEYPQPGGAATVRQLLNHTSGIMSYTAMPGFMEPENTAKPMTTAEMVDYFDDADMPADHGERLAYNNSAFILLGAIIERVTGKSWDAAVRERIASPLGLASLTSGLYEAGIDKMAKGYSQDDGKVVPSQPIHMSLPHAAGALVGTVDDLAKWALALHSGKVVDAPLYAQMTGPSALADGSEIPFGFGLLNAEVRGSATIGHSGGIFGFQTDSIYLPEEDLFVAVLANSDSPKTDPSTLTKKLAALAIGDPYPEYEAQPLDLGALDGVEGRYQFDGAVRDVTLADGKLYTQREGSTRLEVFHAGEGVYFYGPDSATYFTFAAGEDGMAMHFHADGAEEASVGTRVGDAPSGPEDIALDDAQRAALVGTYELPIGPFTIGQEDGRMTGRLGPQDAVVLEAHAPDTLAAPQFGALFAFELVDGRAVAVTLHQGGQEFRGVRQGN